MKYLEKFFDLKPIPAFFAWGAVAFLMISGLASLLIVFPEAVSPGMNVGVKIVLAIGGIGGVLGGLMGSLATETMRSSQAFWDRAKEVQKRLDEAKTKKDLDLIYKEDFSTDTGKLRKLYITGHEHHQEMVRLYTIYDTKYNYLPDK
jgi:hypothetical protein